MFKIDRRKQNLEVARERRCPTRRRALRKEVGRIITTVLYICSEFKIPLGMQVLTKRKLHVLVWSSGKI